MPKKTSSILLKALLVSCLFLLFPTSSAQAQKTFLSQDYIDTTIMRAMYIINESATFAGVGYRHKEAVDKARGILVNLKQKAKGDPNESYILWKASELEAQISLEEEDLRRIEAEKNLLTSNKLVLDYNSEVGKFRPDFGKLRATFRRMSEVDQKQANNLADSYNKRYRQISREALYSLEKALMSGDIDLAKKELDYLEKNKFFLMINVSRFTKMKDRCDNLQSALNEIPKIEGELSRGETAAKEFRLSESRTSLSMAKDRITELRGSLPQKEYSSLSAKADKNIRFLDSREDSLVKVALRILDQKGTEAAGHYLQNDLQKLGLSREKCSYLDQAILNATVPEEDPQEQIVEEYQEDDSEKSEMLNDVRAIARKKAQEKADSIAAAQEAQYLAEARADSLKREEDKKRQMRLRIQQDRAAQISMNIYSMLEKGKVKEAKNLFSKEKQFLSAYLFKDAFEMLDMSVSYSSEEPVATVSVPAAPEKDDKNRKIAKDRMDQIYTLLERNQIKEAYKRFQKDKGPLQKYLDKESYEMLEITVVQSYNYLSN